MQMSISSTLIIIGAGPKALAIAAKATVLSEVGLRVPEIHIVERAEIGAHWSGRAGYTNGRQPLGTPPEKDLGFPYQSTDWGPELSARINREMHRFSWQSFLVAHDRYADWVDRGRPAPEHRHWAQYLQWVAASVGPHVRFHQGTVTTAAIQGDRWSVTFEGLEGREQLWGDGLVLTGPGRVRAPRSTPSHQRILTVESFWRDYLRFQQLDQARITIVGGGETAAAIALGLVQLGRPGLQIDLVTPKGLIYSRGESFRENRVYSDAANGHWSQLTAEHRRDFIRRTDQGVFSQAALQVLDQSDALRLIPGNLVEVSLDAEGLPLIGLEYDGARWRQGSDYVILATGADHLATLNSLLDDRNRDEILARTGLGAFTQEQVEESITTDLSIEGLTPRLHLPMLSAMSQGPGFSNLSCLGRLSDRILEPYVGGAVVEDSTVAEMSTKRGRVVLLPSTDSTKPGTPSLRWPPPPLRPPIQGGKVAGRCAP